MPVLKELVAYLVIERLYKEMAAMPDSPVMEGHRTVRTILVIDEAHNYLGQKNIFIQRITREGRSKGVVVFFASQSPNDHQQKFFNFQELLEFYVYIPMRWRHVRVGARHSWVQRKDCEGPPD
jgi:type IV secretory pathway VirB4 component